MGRNLTSQQQSIERAKVPHRGIDVVSLHVNNKHECYVCYHCLSRRTAEIQDGDDTLEVEIWKAPAWCLDKKMVCMYKDEEKESRRHRIRA